jgi:hypothetical protein
VRNRGSRSLLLEQLWQLFSPSRPDVAEIHADAELERKRTTVAPLEHAALQATMQATALTKLGNSARMPPPVSAAAVKSPQLLRDN